MQRCSLWILPLILLLTACAIWEDPPGAPVVPLTLEPGPTLIFEGICDNNRELADWLQYSVYYADQFSELVKTTAAGNRAAIRSGTIEIATLRQEYAQVVTPDCAEPGQRMFFNAMDRAISGFQRYVNNDSTSLGNLLAEVLGEMDRIKLVQDELRDRLNAQLEQPEGE
jgi:hypothetical protein